MIFDSKEIKYFRNKYVNESDCLIPKIVLLDRLQEFADERTLIESTILQVNKQTQSSWIKGLLNIDDGNHLGTWFEMILFSWLRQIGKIEPQPNINECKPDFLIEHGKMKIVIEATVSRYKCSEQEQRKVECLVYRLLEEMKFPFGFNISHMEITPKIDLKNLESELITWLQKNPEKEFSYSDGKGNHLVMTAKAGVRGVLGPVKFFNIDSGRYYDDLIYKAEQHRAIHDAGYPYIIAILIESSLHSAENVVESWLGKRKIIYDKNSTKFLMEFFDLLGASYENGEIIHDYVSGILVFKTITQPGYEGRKLKGWYIENVNCEKQFKINSSIFPVEDKFIEHKNICGRKYLAREKNSF